LQQQIGDDQALGASLGYYLVLWDEKVDAHEHNGVEMH
jgi:hypothetical protein